MELPLFRKVGLMSFLWNRFPEMLGILLRFAVAFNLSYTRFLDLQIAEKQARAWD